MTHSRHITDNIDEERRMGQTCKNFFLMGTTVAFLLPQRLAQLLEEATPSHSMINPLFAVASAFASFLL